MDRTAQTTASSIVHLQKLSLVIMFSSERFRAGDDWYQLQVKVIRRGEVFFGSEWEARVIERLCRSLYSLNFLIVLTPIEGTSLMVWTLGEFQNGSTDIRRGRNNKIFQRIIDLFTSK